MTVRLTLTMDSLKSLDTMVLVERCRHDRKRTCNFSPLLGPGLREAPGDVLDDPQDGSGSKQEINTLAGIDPLLSVTEEVHEKINHKIDKINIDTNVGSGAAIPTSVRWIFRMG